MTGRRHILNFERARAAMLAAAVVACALMGCKGRKAAAIDPPVAETSGSLTQPVVRGSPVGLELCVVTVRERDGLVASALGEYVDAAVPVAEQTRALWSRHGIRVLSVPTTEVDALVARLSRAAPDDSPGTRTAVRRQWMGQLSAWTEAYAGMERPSGLVVALDGERLRLSAGKLRLITRCWAAPALPRGAEVAEPSQEGLPGGARAALALELLPQHLEQFRPSADFSLTPAKETVDRGGQTFQRLALSCMLDAGYALVIAPERPGVDWSADRPESAVDDSAEPSPDSTTPEIGSVTRVPPEQEPAPNASAGTMDQGPPAAPAPTIGEAMLSVPKRTGDKPAPGLRTVLIFIPRLPERFELIGP